MQDVNRSIAEAYNETPYHSIALPQTAPERLASLATLWGLNPASPDACRVLEIGCATGGNLVPLACRSPGSAYVGVDISPGQIRSGSARVEALGLSNMVLEVADISESIDLGTFDYIICHGVYSWVPPHVQSAILSLCSRSLAPEGIAYVSYNTFPGWKFEEVVRDAMMFWAGDVGDADERLARGRGLVDFLAGATAEDSLMRRVMQQRTATWGDERRDYLLHEYLEANNSPCYFSDFDRQARAHGLAYVGDAIPATMSWAGLRPDVVKAVRSECGEDRIRTEQILDFIVGRKFRQSMLTHAANASRITREPALRTLESLHYGAPIRSLGTLGTGGASRSFESLGGRRFTLSSPIAMAAAEAIGRAWPGTCSWSQLLDESDARWSEEVRTRELHTFLTFAVDCDVVRTRVTAIEASNSPHPMPEAPRHVRRMAELSARESSPTIANAWHDPVALDEVELLLLPELDGSRDVQALVVIVLDAVRSKRLQISEGGRRLEGAELHRVATRLVTSGVASLHAKLLVV